MVNDSGKEVASFGYKEGLCAGGRPCQPKYFTGTVSLEIDRDKLEAHEPIKAELNEFGLQLSWDQKGGIGLMLQGGARPEIYIDDGRGKTVWQAK